MILRTLFIAIFAAAAVGYAQDAASPRPAQSEALKSLVINDELFESMKVPDLTIESALQLIEQWTGRTVIRPAALPTTQMSFSFSRPMMKSEAFLALESILSMNQIGLSPMGDRFIKVVPLPNVRTEAPRMVEGRAQDLPASGVIMTKIFNLEFLRASEFGPQMTQFLNPQLGGPVIFDKSNAVMITDSVSTLQRIESLLEKLDKPITDNLKPKFYPLQYAKASVLVNQLRTILQGAVQNQLGTATTYSSDDRTNQVIVISDPRQHPFFDSLIKKLDVKADPTTRNEVIHLKHANAKEVASLLSQLVSGQNQAASKAGQQSVRPNQTGPAAPIVGPVAPGAQGPGAALAAAGLPANLLEGSNEFSTLVTILPDERSNAVIISGTLSDIQLISDLVSKIDILLAQVRIEVVIAEVSSENSDATGINALGLKFEGNKLTGFVTNGPGVAIGGGEVDSSGNPSGFATITRGDGGYSLAGILSLTAHSVKSKVTILANTTLATTHNKKAEIFVGESRPVFGQIQALDTIGTSTSANSAALRSSITQQEAGIKMAITPLIGADGTVQLEIEQTFNAFGLDVPLGDGLQQPSINKREAKSFLNVGDKEIVALGGYQNSTVSKSRSRLGPIPILGDLLGPRSGSVKRTELMVFIRPHVIRTIEDTTADAMAKIQTSSDPLAVQRSLDLQTAAPATDSTADKEAGRTSIDPNLRRP